MKTFGISPLIKMLILAFVALVDLAQAQYYDYPPPQGPPPRQRRGERQEPAQLPLGEPSGYVSLNFGFVGIPQGNWASTTNMKYGSYGGYATVGTSENISAGIPLNGTNFGVALMLGAYSNPVDMGSYTNNFGNSDSGRYNAANYYQPSGTSYNATVLMGGLFYTYPMGRFSLDFRGMIGIAFCGLPDIYFIGTYGGNQTDSWEVGGTNTTGFATDLGVGLRCVFRRNTCAMLNIDYTGINTSYSTTMTHDYYYVPVSATSANLTPWVANSNQIQVSGSLSMSLVTVSVGIGYQFGSVK